MNTRLAEIIEDSSRIVFFGGAGVSTESGIPDFRGAEGLYSLVPEEIISHSYFFAHTDRFFEFYKSKLCYPDALPNPAHIAIAGLEAAGKLTAVITQNIDGLHQAAGSKTVYELHGSVHRNTCLACGRKYGLDYILASDGVPHCSCGGLIKPDVVLYGENLDEDVWNNAFKKIEEADCMIVAGTSLTVYPAANMVGAFHGKNLVLINKQATPYDGYANLVINDDIVKVTENLTNN